MNISPSEVSTTTTIVVGYFNADDTPEWNLIYASTTKRICARRNQRERGERREVITTLFYYYLKSIPPYQWAYQPKASDIYDDKELAFLAISFRKDHNLSKADIDAAQAKIPEIAKNWVENKRRAFLNLMSSYLRDEGYHQVTFTPETDILQLAIAVFACSVAHTDCAKSPWDGPFSNPLIGYDAAALLQGDSPICHIVFSETGFKAAMFLVKLVGLDPFSATCADMDEKDARFICTKCPVLRQKVALPWTAAVSSSETNFLLINSSNHQVAHSMFKHRHRGGEYTWDLLSPGKTREVKKRERDEIYPKLNDLWCCNLCPAFLDSRKNFYVIKQHIYTRCLIRSSKTTSLTHFHRHGIREPEVPRDIFVYQASRPQSQRLVKL